MFTNDNDGKNAVCFTYEVKMIVHVFADNLQDADAKLDKEGGYISSRKASLLTESVVFNGSEDSK
jgi:hypothetical protein